MRKIFFLDILAIGYQMKLFFETLVDIIEQSLKGQFLKSIANSS